MNRSYSKIRHIQESNRLLEERMLLKEAPVDNTWLSYPNDKNYTYQKQNGKWVAKTKAGKIIDLSKYPTTIKKLETEFPNGKPKVPVNNSQNGGVSTNTNQNVNTQTNSETPQTDNTNQNQTVNTQTGGVSSTATTADTQTQVFGGPLVGSRALNVDGNYKWGDTVQYKFPGLVNKGQGQLVIVKFMGGSENMTSDIKLPMTLEPNANTGPFTVNVKLVKGGTSTVPGPDGIVKYDISGYLYTEKGRANKYQLYCRGNFKITD